MRNIPVKSSGAAAGNLAGDGAWIIGAAGHSSFGITVIGACPTVPFNLAAKACCCSMSC
jgi:hypothetical protein